MSVRFEGAIAVVSVPGSVFKYYGGSGVDPNDVVEFEIEGVIDRPDWTSWPRHAHMGAEDRGRLLRILRDVSLRALAARKTETCCSGMADGMGHSADCPMADSE
jgi:hypothetical protein